MCRAPCSQALGRLAGSGGTGGPSASWLCFPAPGRARVHMLPVAGTAPPHTHLAPHPGFSRVDTRNRPSQAMWRGKALCSKTFFF